MDDLRPYDRVHTGKELKLQIDLGLRAVGTASDIGPVWLQCRRLASVRMDAAEGRESLGLGFRSGKPAETLHPPEDTTVGSFGPLASRSNTQSTRTHQLHEPIRRVIWQAS